jgi:hypothetical protein
MNSEEIEVKLRKIITTRSVSMQNLVPRPITLDQHDPDQNQLNYD